MSPSEPPAADRAPTPVRFVKEGEGWHLRSRRPLVLRVAAVLILLVLGLPALDWARHGDWRSAVPLLLFVLALVALLLAPRNNRARPLATVTVDDQAGLLLPVNPLRLPAMVALAVLGPLLLVGAGVLAYAAVTERAWVNLIGTALLGSIGLLFLVGVRGVIRARRTADRGILLTSQAVVMRTQTPHVSVPWDQVSTIRDHWRRTVGRFGVPLPTDQLANLLSVVRRDDGPVPLPVDAALMAGDPVGFREVLRHYLAHPEHRTELGTDAALARAAAIGRAVGSPSP